MISVQTWYGVIDKNNLILHIPAYTIKHYHANIHRALAYAVRMDMVLTNESEKTERPKLEKYEANFYNEKELERLF